MTPSEQKLLDEVIDEIMDSSFRTVPRSMTPGEHWTVEEMMRMFSKMSMNIPKYRSYLDLEFKPLELENPYPKYQPWFRISTNMLPMPMRPEKAEWRESWSFTQWYTPPIILPNESIITACV